MFPRMFELFGSCSKRTSSTSTVSRLSFVSVRNSRSRSSIGHKTFVARHDRWPLPFGSEVSVLQNGLRIGCGTRSKKGKITTFRGHSAAGIPLQTQPIGADPHSRSRRPRASAGGQHNALALRRKRHVHSAAACKQAGKERLDRVRVDSVTL